MKFRRLLTGVAILAVTVATGAVPPATASPPAERSPADVVVGVPSQIASRADTTQCLTYVAAEHVPMAVMLPCNPAPTAEVQKWTLTTKGELKVSLSQSVGGEVATTGACLDTAMDVVRVPDAAPVLVLPCRGTKGQTWKFDAEAGTFVNAASGQTLSSMLGLAKQARPVGLEPANGSSAQAWEQIPVPDLDLLGAIMALVNAILSALGLSLPIPVQQAACDLIELIRETLPIPAQMEVLPEQMLDHVR